MAERTCEWCGKPLTEWQRAGSCYCDNAGKCRQAAYRARRDPAEVERQRASARRREQARRDLEARLRRGLF